MSLKYELKQNKVIVGSKDSSGTITRSTLTGTASDNRGYLYGTGLMYKMDIMFSYTTGSGETNNTLNIIVEQSPDNTNWYKIPNESVSSGTSTLDDRTFSYASNTGGGTTSNGSIGLDIFYENIRVSFTESGVVTNAGSVYSEVNLF